MSRKYNCILVTGGSGFIGSAFIRYVLQHTNFHGKLINIDALTYAGNPSNLKSIEQDPRYHFIHDSITNPNTLSNISDSYPLDLIVHFAAESHVDRSIFSPLDFVHTNILGTVNLLELLKEKPSIHFHHISTDEVYGSLGENGLFKESTPYNPNSPYSASKASSDHFVRAYSHTYNLKTTLSNCSNNYGPYQFPEKLIPLIFLKCQEKASIPIYGKGDNIRDWLHVNDHVKGVWTLIHYAPFGSSYNIGGDCEKSNLQIAKQCIHTYAALTDQNPKDLLSLLSFVEDRPGHDFRYAVDCNLVKKDFGWKAEYSFDKGLYTTYQWYLQNPQWIEGIGDGSYRKWLEKNYAERLSL